ncbi:hypothetical protein G5714_009129 [Onychostoma macrolepis]|uniref:Uncharacterized protein n=1 Tax=Onychostoma macrolepis TaxID=369639 RepID=A0A7J6CRA9_9TELE|nr:hypothetical protein G5714_009129 [Onychostoma macrolepis]
MASVFKVSKLSRIEGRNLKDSARRMLNRVLINSLMSIFNMKGGGPLQKEAFEKTALFSVIRDAVMTNFPAATELDLRNAEMVLSVY